MGTGETGQLISSAARIYDDFFVPALFEEWPPYLLSAAEIKAGDHVLDVACGTGVLSLAAHKKVLPAGSVTGLDINEPMLQIAGQKEPGITWKLGRAEALPFEDHRFDAVISQFGLMFFEDKAAAIREMMRVLRPGGRMVAAVWGSLRQAPGYAALASLLERLFGEEVAQALHAPFILGDQGDLRAIFSEAGFPQVQIETKTGKARFPSIHAWIYTEIRGWTLADRLTDQQFDVLESEAEATLREFVKPDGEVAFNICANIALLQK